MRLSKPLGLEHVETTRRNLHVPLISYYFYYFQWKLYIRGRYFLRKQLKYPGFCSVNIETYAFCNRNCYFCFNHDRFPKRKQGIMHEALFQSVIDRLAELNFKGRLSPYFYGEPLLDRRLLELIEYAKRKLPKCNIHISTNGDMLDEELFKKLVGKGADIFYITDYNDAGSPHLKMLAAKYPVHIKLRSYKSASFDDRGGEIFKKYRTFNVPCLRPSSQLVINWKGDVLLCCQDFYGKYCMGNVSNQDLLEIWRGKKFAAIREKLRHGARATIPICKHCDNSGAIAF
jgi:GTP 3',8-cyclase